MSGWWLLLTHLLCFGAGGFVFTHPDDVKAWVMAQLDRIKKKPDAKP